jgi:hypothetical protein
VPAGIAALVLQLRVDAGAREALPPPSRPCIYAASYPWNSQWPSYGTLRDLVQTPYFNRDIFNNSALPYTVRAFPWGWGDGTG